MKRVILVGVNRVQDRGPALAAVSRFRSHAANTLEDSMPFGEIDIRDVPDARAAMDLAFQDQDPASIFFFEHDPLHDYPGLVKDAIANKGRSDQVVVVRDRMPLHRVHEVSVAWLDKLGFEGVITP